MPLSDQKYREEHHDEILKKAREYRLKHREYRLKNREQCNAYHREWYARNRERTIRRAVEYRRAHPEIAKITRRKLLEEVIQHYSPGMCCVRCGYNDIRALTIDHIDGNGKKHRDAIGGGGTVLYYWLRNNGYPDGFQVLCMNCQFIKRDEKGEASGKPITTNWTRKTIDWETVKA